MVARPDPKKKYGTDWMKALDIKFKVHKRNILGKRRNDNVHFVLVAR